MVKRRPMMRRSARMRRTKGLQLVVMLLLFLLYRRRSEMCRTDYHGVRNSYGMTRGRGRPSLIQNM